MSLKKAVYGSCEPKLTRLKLEIKAGEDPEVGNVSMRTFAHRGAVFYIGERIQEQDTAGFEVR